MKCIYKVEGNPLPLNMQLTKEQVKKYQEIYLKHFGQEISYEKALKQGGALVNLVSLVVSETDTSITPPYHSITNNIGTTI